VLVFLWSILYTLTWNQE